MTDLSFQWEKSLGIQQNSFVDTPSIDISEDKSIFLATRHSISKFNPNGSQAWKKDYLENPEIPIISSNHPSTKMPEKKISFMSKLSDMFSGYSHFFSSYDF